MKLHWWHGWRQPKKGVWQLDVPPVNPGIPEPPRVHWPNWLAWLPRALRQLVIGWVTMGTIGGLLIRTAGLPSVLPASTVGPFTPVYNVKLYGAKGDGVTDDTAAVQAAINDAASAVQWFGTSLLGAPTVVVPPQVPGGSGTTRGYLITSTLTIPRGIRLVGAGGLFAPQLTFMPASNNATLFTFFGTAEAQTALLSFENLQFFQNGTASTSIGFRVRNFSTVQCVNCLFSNFRVGIWADWGLDLVLQRCQFSLCGRGVQTGTGANAAQTETPAPPAGIRGGPGTQFTDFIRISYTAFSQNQVDINDMGSTQADGGLWVRDCTFFESSASPVSGKFRMISITSRKSVVIQGCSFEQPNSNRTPVFFGAFNYDGGAGAANFGVLIEGNHFLVTNATGSASINISRAGGCVIQGNIFEVATTGTTVHLVLADVTDSTFVGVNSYLSYPDVETTPLMTITGAHNIWRAAASNSSPAFGTSDGTQGLAWGASVAISVITGNYFTLTATSNIAATIAAPTGASVAATQGQEITIEIFNNSGGALTTPVAFAVGAGAFLASGGVSPANGLTIEVKFRFNQARNRWIEVARGVAV